MHNIYNIIRKLAKSTESQNLLSIIKETRALQFFNNKNNLSKIQYIYLSYLFFYDSISRDILLEGISKKVYDSEIYEDAYMKWKSEKKDNKKSEEKSNDLRLIASKKIVFPKEEK